MTREYWCHSKHEHVRADTHFVQDGWTPDGKRYMVLCHDDMTRECQYRKGTPADPQCEGCTAP